MSDSNSIPKLRMASRENLDDVARRIEREQQARLQERERTLDEMPVPFRIGSVPYLNAVPLTRGLEDRVLYLPPSALAQALRGGDLDAALVSVTEVLRTDRYDVLDGIGVCSLGEVKSVLLAHRIPLEEVRQVHCDPASLTSRLLLEVLLAERGLTPEFVPLASYQPSTWPDAVLLIGDVALDFLHADHDHRIWDLGTAWYEMSGLPFVYAVWALPRGPDRAALSRVLREAKGFGLQTLEAIVASRTEYTLEFRRDYLSWHIHYHLGSDEKRGLARFVELLRKHRLGPVFEPTFVA